MAKTKALTPQELYAARKQREEEEKQALMPPGLINQGNTCFMNSVLQGLIATRLLADLIYFRPLPSDVQSHSATLLAPRRSPLLTNGTKLAGQYQQKWVDSMPIGDVFVNVMLKAWDAQRNRKRDNQTPRSLLSALGRKYDQYLDFAQQDAHEFMRILLDAMRMEEFDVIKKRQPQPQPTKKRRRKQFSHTADDEERLISLSDMIFGGKLTSILVCQKCKHVSQTYEDFNDLSLSIKPEDYAKERKRDRLKNLAKRLAVFPTSFPSSSLRIEEHPPRSSSAPPGTPREIPQIVGQDESPIMDDPRRKSIDVVPDPPTPAASIVSEVAESARSEESVPASDKHLEFVDAPKPEREKKNDDGWGRLGRRLSMGLYSAKERKSRSRERHSSQDFTHTESSATTVVDPVAPAPVRPDTPTISLPDAVYSPKPVGATSDATSPTPSRPASKTRVTPIARSRSPKPPKPSRAETEYLRKILADVTYSSTNPFARLNHAVEHTSAQSMWFKMGQLPGIEDCLKMFTAVEILDGDNKVRCRRCWKIANGLYTPKVDHDDSDSVDGHPVESLVDDISQESLESDSDIPTSLSTPELSDYSHTSSDDPGASMVSLPTTIAGSTPESAGVKHAPAPLGLKVSPGGLPIPLISTTAPPTPEDSPPPTARPASLDSYESRHSSRSIDTHSNHDTRHLSLSAESLLPAPSNHRPQPQTDEEEYEDESSSSEEDDTSEAESLKPGEKRSPVKKKPKPFIIRPAYKRYLIATPPPVLVVHLKRFQQLSKTPMLSFSNGFKKLDDYITFPEILDLTPFLAPRKEDFARTGAKREPEKCLYRLYAVVVHIGNMLGGHYIAYTALPTPPEDQLQTPTAGAPVKPKARQWAYISDTVVRLTTLEEVLKAKAYICMYERI